MDLYPEESWNFVFGYASYFERIGVFSIARYDPLFYEQERTGQFPEERLLRSCKILAHETGHMFSMAHCVFYHCCMNGSNSLEESDAQPIHLCPVCLEKLGSSVEFGLIERCRMLDDFYRAEKTSGNSLNGQGDAWAG